jgi:hypothetical protein
MPTVASQCKVFRKLITYAGKQCSMTVTVRYDDSLQNGANELSVTGTIRGPGVDVGGCVHGDIAEHFPELSHLVPWHLCSSDGPLHYIDNTVYLAGDRDCWGLAKGEVGRGGRVGTGKERELDEARQSAIWPDATDDDLTSPGLADRLRARLPALLAEFRRVIEEFGFDCLDTTPTREKP